MCKKTIPRLLSFIVFFLCIAVAGRAQDLLRNTDLSSIKVDNISDADILKFKKQLDASGLTQQQAEQLAISKGMSVSEVQKLRQRLQQLSSASNNQNNQNQLNGLQNNQLNSSNNLLNPQDTSANPHIDTTEHKPLINPRIFGSELFNNPTLNFQPNIPVATPVNYIIGPNDQLNINVYGVQETSMQLTVAPEGNIIIPNVGQVQVAGLSIEDATQKISALMGRTAYSTLRSGASKLSITVGQIKSISITVIGSNKPGNYTVPSLATAFNALFVAGGPAEFGSFRNIELIRNNKLYKTIDLYRFLVNGDGSDNVTLQNNDVIRIPTYKTRVIIDGYVKRPGIFEMLPGENLADLFTFCSGFTDSAYKASVKIVQFTGRDLSVKDVSAANFGFYQMQGGDSVIASKVLNRFSNRITLTGAVFREGIYELTDGMTLRDLINKADGLREDAFMERAQIFRLKNDFSKELLSFNPSDTIEERNILLKREDSVVINSIFDLRDQYFVSVLGEVRNPGYYDYRDSLSLKDVILQAGGFTDAAFPQRIEVARLIRSDSLTAQDVRASTIIEVNDIGDISAINNNVFLQPSDIVTIKRKPGFRAFQSVTVSGQLQYPGPYVLEKREERVSDLIKRAGGFTPEAYLDGAYIKRYNLSDQTAQARQQSISNIQQQTDDSTVMLQQQDTQKQSDQLPLDVKEILSHPGSPEDVVLMPGDEFIVPKYNAEVRISGSVLFPTQIPYNKTYSVNDYIAAAGGASENGKRSKTYVVYANGKAAAKRGFLFFKGSPEVKPGAEVIVPMKEERTKLSPAQFIAMASAVASLAAVVIAILKL
ncbi:SLBB domain-containing protein [Parafilimonas sp.]|uniref:SLBB domain-containing protein n=1 Tax=Parafilimonas sp. TaxID=1969739 RepID=UPI0039E2EF28